MIAVWGAHCAKLCVPHGKFMKCGTGQSRRAQALLEYGINGVADNRHYGIFVRSAIWNATLVFREPFEKLTDEFAREPLS
jgi:hypothetical protein